VNNPASPTQTFSGNPLEWIQEQVIEAGEAWEATMASEIIRQRNRAQEDLEITEARLIQHRLLLLKVYGCIKSFEDSSGYMPSDRQEFRDLELVGEDIAGVLGV
jgi:hypothetical protein